MTWGRIPFGCEERLCGIWNSKEAGEAVEKRKFAVAKKNVKAAVKA